MFQTSRGLLRDTAREEMSMISVMIWVGCQQASCVCLKASVKCKTVQKLLKKINTAPIPNKCLFEIKCWANTLALIITYRENGIHFVDRLFAEVGTQGILSLRVVQIKGYTLPVC